MTIMNLAIALLCAVFVASAADGATDPLDYISKLDVRQKLASLVQKRNFINQVNADEAKSWFDEEAKKFIEELREAPGGMAPFKKDLVFLHAADQQICSTDFGFLVLDLIEAVKLNYPDPRAAQYARHVCMERLAGCASEFDRQFRRSGRHMLEWTMDKFFERLSHVKLDGDREQQLFHSAADFQHDQSAEVCTLARAFNRLTRADANYWRDERSADKLEQYLRRAEARNCEQSVADFFETTCQSDRRDENQRNQKAIEQVNLALALGAKANELLGMRTRKYNEYQRICNVFWANQQMSA